VSELICERVWVEEERLEVRGLELFISAGGCLFVRGPSAFDSAKASLCAD
jgi:hypothetical protein